MIALKALFVLIFIVSCDNLEKKVDTRGAPGESDDTVTEPGSQNQKPGNPEPDDKNPGIELVNGAALYKSYCSNCHGSLEQSVKRNRTVAQIKEAIFDVPSMKFLETLNDEELQAISDEISKELTGRLSSFRLPVGDQRYMSSVFKDLFSATENRTEDDDLIDASIKTNISDRLMTFGSNCKTTDATCPSVRLLELANRNMNIPNVNASRRGFINLTCTEVLDIDKAVANVLAKASLSPVDTISKSSLSDVFKVFHPGLAVPTSTLTEFEALAAAAEAEFNRLEAWRISLYALCSSPLMELTFSQSSERVGTFHRCYSQIAGVKASSDHPQLVAVRDQGKDPIVACGEVLDAVVFQETGSLADTANEEHKNVVATFQKLHSTWFSYHTFAEDDFAFLVSKTLYDQEVPAMYYTKALFQNEFSYTNVFSGSHNLRAIRTDQDPSQNSNLTFNGIQFPLMKVQFAYGQSTPLAPIGELLGVESDALNRSYTKVIPPDDPVTETMDINPTFGGGVIGSVPYLMQTTNIDDEFVADGALAVARLFGQAIYNDFLCRDLPAVRYEDIESFVDATSPTPFRTTPGCVACHASMDQTAGLVRNYKPSATSAEGVTGFFAPVPTFGPTLNTAESAWPTASDPDYATRPTNGKLLFRNYLGQKIDVNFATYETLGTALLGQLDTYICTTQRYYEYFTGIKIRATDDISDPSYGYPITDKDKWHREKIIEMAVEFEQHRDMRRLIKEIIGQPHYRRSDFGVGE